MNTYQILRQVKYLLLSRNWSGSSNKLFASGSVLISAGLTDAAKPHIRVPFALISPEDASVDPSHRNEPDLIQQSIRITICNAVPGDVLGENAIIGANIPDRTKSEGRGLLELEEEVFAAVQFLSTDNGVVIQHVATGAARPLIDPDLGYVLSREYTFEAQTTASRFYHPPIRLSATGGAGSVSLSWTLPPDRYDRFRVVLRRASGATAPATVTSGTGVTLSGNLATSVTDSGLAAGTYSYSLFAQYDETNSTPSQADRTSAAVSKTSITVT
jgi:hypothetical protein